MLVSFFFFKQKTAYEMRISDWSSDVCSSDLISRRKEKRPFNRIHQYIWRQFHNAFVAKLFLQHAVILPAHGDAFRHSAQEMQNGQPDRSEERRVGNECVSTWRSRGWADHKKKKYIDKSISVI